MLKYSIKKIEWLIPIPDCTLEKAANSNLASVRMRSALSLMEFKKLGFDVSFSDGNTNSYPNVLFVGKIDVVTDILRCERWLRYIENCKEHGCHVIIDYTDHHLSKSGPHFDFYAKALTLADYVTCSSRLLAKHINKFSNLKPIIIADPIEIDFKIPTQKNNAIPTALWFGHATNLPYLIEFFGKLKYFKKEINIIAITNAHPIPEEIIQKLENILPRNVNVSFIPWSQDALIEASNISDFAIIPAGVNDDRKSGASSNRLTTSLALGLPTFADPLDSYEEFGEFYLELSPENISELINNSNTDIFEKVLKSQKHIAKHFIKSEIAKEWMKVINCIAENDAQESARKKNPKLSIIIVIYNQLGFCKELVNNILSYVSSDVEIVLCDDHSTDGTYEFIKNHLSKYNNIIINRNESNLGVLANLKAGVQSANGDYFVFHGGDDYIDTKGLNNLLLSLEKNFDIIYSKGYKAKQEVLIKYLKEDCNPKLLLDGYFLNDVIFTDPKPSANEIIVKSAIIPGYIWLQCICLKRDLMLEAGFLPDGGVDDWGLLHNISVLARSRKINMGFLNINTVLVGNVEGSRGNNFLEMLEVQIRAVKKYWDSSFKKGAMQNLLIKKIIAASKNSNSDEIMAITLLRTAQILLENDK